ncbi:hypothetical protein BJ085DRAFT_27232 [Dimargaris cristalligena]|uniref:Uncharacterized protein n=1 Tax=Dimargaris cristalligena TaxID=215637 RepID=A0A4P9ZJL8_9FUNG|nr:hypothetical protein BJ085DRAFT_27232 [Dimargaris cristalligena]|eukprot:RKP33263.1 hypothetical protein BJ085DRAFT_27232 [Dimargaris cristalligena]
MYPVAEDLKRVLILKYGYPADGGPISLPTAGSGSSASPASSSALSSSPIAVAAIPTNSPPQPRSSCCTGKAPAPASCCSSGRTDIDPPPANCGPCRCSPTTCQCPSTGAGGCCSRPPTGTGSPSPTEPQGEARATDQPAVPHSSRTVYIDRDGAPACACGCQKPAGECGHCLKDLCEATLFNWPTNV